MLFVSKFKTKSTFAFVCDVYKVVKVCYIDITIIVLANVRARSMFVEIDVC